MVWLSLLTTTIFLDPCNIASLITNTFKNNFLKSAVSFHVVSRERWCVCVCVCIRLLRKIIQSCSVYISIYT
jgi:hypothetical protein